MKKVWTPSTSTLLVSGESINVGTIESLIYDPRQPLGGLTEEEFVNSKVLLWKGYCHVHTHFTVDHVAAAQGNVPARPRRVDIRALDGRPDLAAARQRGENRGGSCRWLGHPGRPLQRP